MHVSLTVPTEDPRDARTVYPELERIGYDRAFSFEAKHDPFVPLAVAAEHTDMGPNMAPAVLLAAFLLTLLLAAPLAPTRRVRPGTGGYQGRRRKG